MKAFNKIFEIRWGDLDPNFHVKHTVYYDFAATTRIALMQHLKIDMAYMMQHHFGPILFREEAIFKKELLLGDVVSVFPLLSKAKKDYSRWSFTQNIIKNEDTLSAIVNVDGAFIDTKLRKLTIPTELVQSLFATIEKTDDFTWID